MIKGVQLTEPPILYRGERILSLAEKLADPKSIKALSDILDPCFAAALYYLFFLPYPIIEERHDLPPNDMKKLQLLRMISSSTQISAIKRYTIADSATSMVAAAVFINNLVKELQRSAQSKSGRSGSRGENSWKEKVGVKDDSMIAGDEAKLRRIIEKALRESLEVTKQAKEIRNYVARFGAGTGSMLSLEDSVSDILRLARNTDVQLILETLKSVEDVEAKIKKRVRRTPRGELDGYELGSDIERVVLSELALPFEAFALKLAESSLLLYRKIVQEGAGPFHVLLDKSGSMMGLKIIWAKAVAIALAQRAARERRTFILRFFDSIPYPPIKISKRTRGRDVIRLLEYVARVRANGGTDITRAILTAVEDIINTKDKKPSDIVLITDGEDKIAIDAVKRGLARANARLHTVMIHGNNPDLRMVSTTYMTVVKLDRENALKVILSVTK